MFNNNIKERDRRIFHIIYNSLDTSKDIVIENLKDDTYDKTEHCSKEGHFNTTGNYCSGNITCLLDFIESLNHTDNCTHETEHRSKGDKQ